jgi:integrase
MPSKVLNEQFIKTGLVCPESRNHIEYTSDDRSGLYIEVRSTSQGKGTYWFRFKEKDTGKTARVKVGRTTDISIRDAKEQVKTLRARLQLGTDLAAEQRKKKEILTWTDFFDQWYLPHARQHLRSWSNLEEMHRLRIKERFGDLKLNKITRHAVQQFHSDLRDAGLSPASCDHYLKLIRQALNQAVSWSLLDNNPVARIQLFNADNRVEHVMDKGQLQQLIATLDNVAHRRRMASLAIKFLLFTGARVNEALNARWKDIDRKNRTWTIQAKTSKGKRRRSVPLNDAAMAVLNRLGTSGNSEWLFTSNRGDGNQRMTTINKVWQEIRKDAGLPWLRLHDLRHNFASMLVNSGRTLYEVQQILGHSQSQVTERYAHLSTATLQDAANSASTYLDKALKSAGE